MKLPMRTQYGLRMLCQMASEFENGPMQMSEIAEREGVSEKYLGQIMLVLRSSGLVSSIRGAQGGYYLNSPPDRINLLQVFEVLEGAVFDFDNAPEDLAPQSECKSTLPGANMVWSKVRKAIEDVLRAYTLEDVVRLGMYKAGYMDFRI